MIRKNVVRHFLRISYSKFIIQYSKSIRGVDSIENATCIPSDHKTLVTHEHASYFEVSAFQSNRYSQYFWAEIVEKRLS